MDRHASGQKVVVAMSGGVDSSVAAGLLKEQGYDVVGCFMRLGSVDQEPGPADACGNAKPHHQGCCSVSDAADAQLVAAHLDVPLYVLNFRESFGRVIDYFVSEYNAGRTPNPCVRCNDWLKFGHLAEHADAIDADWIASGHYAQLQHGPAGPRLLAGVDADKDQSYVLFGVSRRRLARMLLPIGAMRKADVRAAARRMGLPVHDKPESQEICFVPDNDYAGLVQRRSPDRVRPGPIVDTAGKVVGEHGGQQRFTIGQRRGLSLALGYPVYVVDKDVASNTVTVGPRERLLSRALSASQANWLIDPPTVPIRCTARVRYNSAAEPATVHAPAPDRIELRFDQPQAAVTPGQAVVCYDGPRVLGGGWIDQARAG